MYVGSLFFLLAAVAALFIGFRGSNLLLVYGSIAFSVLSMLFLAADAARRRRLEPDPAPIPSEWSRLPVGAVAPVAHDIPEPIPASPDEGAMVVALAERGTFHRPECHHVRGKGGTERMSAVQAEARGLTACGVCKPV